jgi:hypothetical protein
MGEESRRNRLAMPRQIQRRSITTPAPLVDRQKGTSGFPKRSGGVPRHSRAVKPTGSIGGPR